MNKIIIASLIASTITAFSIEKKPLEQVNIDAFTEDTQVMPIGSGDNHIAIIWWIPTEYWESILLRDTSTSKADKKAMIDTLSGTSLLAVAQADISQLGAFKLYSKKGISKKMTISCTSADGENVKLSPIKEINPDLEVVLGTFKPILGAALGHLGKSLHFFVLNDKSKSSKRLLDPYSKGQIRIKIPRKDKVVLNANIDLPLNSLFVPRKCPNGKDAHISWSYCPWTGKNLAE